MDEGRLTAQGSPDPTPHDPHSGATKNHSLTHSGEPEPTVYHRHLAARLTRSNDENVRALPEQARRRLRGFHLTRSLHEGHQ